MATETLDEFTGGKIFIEHHQTSYVSPIDYVTTRLPRALIGVASGIGPPTRATVRQGVFREISAALRAIFSGRC